MHSLIVEHIADLGPIAYLVLGLGVAIDGEPFLFAASFLAFSGYLNPYYAAITIFVFTVVGDVGWYYLGTHFNSLPKALQRWMGKIARPFDDSLVKKPWKILFVSKFAYGIHHALCLRSGNIKFDLKKFVIINIVTTIPWILVMGGVTYAFSASFQSAIKYVGYIEIGLLIGLIVFIYIQHKLGAAITEKLEEAEGIIPPKS